MSFPQKFTPFGIRPNSTYYGSAYIGTSSTPNAGVEVDLWGGNTQGPINSVIQHCTKVIR